MRIKFSLLSFAFRRLSQTIGAVCIQDNQALNLIGDADDSEVGTFNVTKIKTIVSIFKKTVVSLDEKSIHKIKNPIDSAIKLNKDKY